DPWSMEGRLALEDPNAPDLRPFWHQWVGVTKIMYNMMQWLPTLVLDQVGVGKTMQAIGAIAMYEWLRLYHQSHKEYMRGLCESFTPPSPSSRLLTLGIHVVVCTSGLVDQWIAEIHRCLKGTKFCAFPYTG
ncbi:hypothetical protein FKP32DRAFT_1532741, partial [Trametes sanguinea]